MHQNLIKILVLAIVIIASCSYGSADDLYGKGPPSPFQDWDYLLFSQRWPITACSEWEEHSKNNQCNLPPDPTLWTIHGIWPTKIGTTGPYFCDSVIHFDMNQIQPILTDLENYWTNVENNTKLNSLWKHEWSKHGTCASILPQLNSVFNYFERGLVWTKQYAISAILAEANIVPNTGGYKVEDIFNVIKNATGKSPTVQCIVDGKSKQSFINEIRLCFNKTLDIIDCNVKQPDASLTNDGDNVLSNCNLDKPVMYYPKVPTDLLGADSDEDYPETCMDNLSYIEDLAYSYHFIKFLIWFTL